MYSIYIIVVYYYIIDQSNHIHHHRPPTTNDNDIDSHRHDIVTHTYDHNDIMSKGSSNTMGRIMHNDNGIVSKRDDKKSNISRQKMKGRIHIYNTSRYDGSILDRYDSNRDEVLKSMKNIYSKQLSANIISRSKLYNNNNNNKKSNTFITSCDNNSNKINRYRNSRIDRSRKERYRYNSSIYSNTIYDDSSKQYRDIMSKTIDIQNKCSNDVRYIRHTGSRLYRSMNSIHKDNMISYDRMNSILNKDIDNIDNRQQHQFDMIRLKTNYHNKTANLMIDLIKDKKKVFNIIQKHI